MTRLSPPGSVSEVAVLFSKLGLMAFGGPAAHIALMRDEVVRRRRWVSDQEFLDLLGASNLIPGPTSTELAIYLGYVRAGWRGLLLAGVCFILPAALIVLALAWAYVRYGATPAATWLLYGIKPVIIAVIMQAIWMLAIAAVKGPLLGAIGVLVLVLYWLGFNAVGLLLASGLLVMMIQNARRLPSLGLLKRSFVLAAGAPAMSLAAGGTAVTLTTLFLTFLKIGAILYGSGYVLLALVRADFVLRLRWLTDQQLIDAVAVGQFTPGPVFTTATFIGYLVGGLRGATLATVAIFLPSFLFVAAVYPVVPRLRRSPWASGLLDGVNVAALGLMAAVTLQLAGAAVVDWLSATLTVLAAALLIGFRPNSAWLIAGGGAIGVAYHLLAR